MSMLTQVSQLYSRLVAGRVLPVEWPKARPLKQAFAHQYGFVPDLTAADGSGWGLNGSQLVRYASDGSVVYTVQPTTDINASCTVIRAFWVDYANDRVYMVGDDASTTAWLAFTTRATKSMTVRGSGTLTSGLASTYGHFLQRNAAGAFLLYQWGTLSNAPTTSYRSVITEASGAVAAAAWTLAGVRPSMGAGLGPATPTGYVTADETLAAMLVTQTTTELRICRGGSIGSMPIAGTSMGHVVLNATLGASVNGDYVTLSGYAGGVPFPRHYLRADWDKFLHAAADRMGLPR